MEAGTEQVKIKENIPVVSPLDPTVLGPNTKALKQYLEDRVIGQEEAIEAVCRVVQVARAGLTSPTKPRGSLLFLGPTGTGKTYLIETLAMYLHGSAKAMLRVDCAEFQSEHEVAKLIGAPPGYLGHDKNAAILANAKIVALGSEKEPTSIILFDEIEKAAPSLWRLLLSVLDKGRLTMGDGQVTDFSKCIIFFTSNLGVKEIMNAINPGVGFNPGPGVGDKGLTRKLENVTAGAVGKHFSPEFINRLDYQITFNPLSQDELVEITGLELEKFRLLLRKWAVGLKVQPEVLEYISTLRANPKFGARQLKRMMDREIIVPISNILESKQVNMGDTIQVSLADGALSFGRVE